PDLVILVVGSYLCAVALVSEQVRHRFGARAHRWYVALERRFDRRTRPSGGTPGRTNSLARRIVRRVIGARPYATVEEVAGCYEEMLRRLASREGMQVVVFMEPSWPAWVDAENKGAIAAWSGVVPRAKAAADTHHFPWAESNPLFATAPDRDALYMPDGDHKTIEGHRYQANALIPVLLDPANGLVSARP
ncbi:MAG TPA: SGNH/GDSL hydrolase family protein, partial [Tepidiformaceae bacterium]|nr:SGNH/GDSL hydrolase family protein [Tepidiformaceae bacterium]